VRAAGGRGGCWGDDTYGRLGRGRPTAVVGPAPVLGLVSVKALAVGPTFTCALTGDGSVSCWGDDDFGQLGAGSLASPIPEMVVGL
jgi:alpha-tubulin suppressor-like RCC1 family protein